ncbi:hypothetical protein GT755_22770 [Herbidospora sp. NEAU-GS84]|uniref:Secreted protein n=1 Tax=Herbidospora solisilvae TaxID=2696284 RepID=A0A7C9J5N9_9ACTN|nr:DUF6153 family protein [Herbidospora solisilvae]NAS24500.1 hypothetical protein [Herbidospora solisilvae]
MLVLAVLSGLLAMHHLTFSVTGHGHAAATASAAHQHVKSACHHNQTDPATCLTHAVLCCATTIGKGGPTPPTLSASVIGLLPVTVPSAILPEGVRDGRAPPDPISLQVLRI